MNRSSDSQTGDFDPSYDQAEPIPVIEYSLDGKYASLASERGLYLLDPRNGLPAVFEKGDFFQISVIDRSRKALAIDYMRKNGLFRSSKLIEWIMVDAGEHREVVYEDILAATLALMARVERVEDRDSSVVFEPTKDVDSSTSTAAGHPQPPSLKSIKKWTGKYKTISSS